MNNLKIETVRKFAVKGLVISLLTCLFIAIAIRLFFYLHIDSKFGEIIYATLYFIGMGSIIGIELFLLILIVQFIIKKIRR